MAEAMRCMEPRIGLVAGKVNYGAVRLCASIAAADCDYVPHT
jgi:hypothetical protein